MKTDCLESLRIELLGAIDIVNVAIQASQRQDFRTCDVVPARLPLGSSRATGPTKGDSASGDIADKVASLTQQQHRILMMFAEGMLNKQIAYDLNVSEATIKAHATAIFRKLNVRNRTQAVIAISELDISEGNPEQS